MFPEIGEDWKAIHRRALAGETVMANGAEFQRADGHVEWLNWEVRPWYRAAEQIGGVVIYSEDVSALVNARAALADSEARFKGLAEAIRIGQAQSGVTRLRTADAPQPSGPDLSMDSALPSAPERRGIVDRLRAANDILAGLPDPLFDCLAEQLTPVSYDAGTTLVEPLQAVNTIYFPIEGLNAAILHLADGTSAEVAIGGHGGLVGVAPFAGAAFEETETRALMAGSALAISARDMREAMAAHPELRERLAWVLPMIMGQISLCVACNARHSVRQRLARWLLTASAGVGSRDLAIGQEAIANSLGVRRAGVSEVLTELKREGLVSTGRTLISILNVPGLEAHACECYREGLAARARYAKASAGPRPSGEDIRALLDQYRGLKQPARRPLRHRP